MGISDVAGVFSRYFIVGFFLPATFTLVAVAQLFHPSARPSIYNAAQPAEQIAILGGVGLLVGLLLLGLNYPIIRLYEGYPLREKKTWWGLKSIYRCALERQTDRFDRMKVHKASEDENERFDAEWRLGRRFPYDDRRLILPTTFGNAVRAFERHSFIRWRLNAIAIWPYIESQLSEQESSALADARGEVAFFVNGSLLSALATVAIAVERLVDGPSAEMLFALIPAAISILLYSASIGAAIRWGDVVRASIDLHRREVYTKLGIKTPKTFTHEWWTAWHLNNTLMTGVKMPDDQAAAPTKEGDPSGP